MKRQLRVELGHAWLPAKDAAHFGPGSEIVLDEPAGCDAEIVAAGRRIARGELVVTDGCFCVRTDDVMHSGLAAADCGPPRSGPEVGQSDREH